MLTARDPHSNLTTSDTVRTRENSDELETHRDDRIAASWSLSELSHRKLEKQVLS